MKELLKKDIKRNAFFFYIVMAFSLQSISTAYTITTHIFFIWTMFSVIFLYILKNRYLATICCVATVSLIAIWYPKYMFFCMIAILLICTHKNIMENISDKTKKKKNDTFTFLLMQVSFFLSIGLIIYSFVISVGNEQSLLLNIGRLNYLLICFVVLFVFVMACKNKSYTDLTFFYFICILGYIGTALYYNAEVWSLSIGPYIAFFPWFLLLCSMFYNSDPYINAISDKLESTLSKTPDKK